MKIKDLFLLAAPGLFTSLISLYTTSSGSGLAPDSYVYVATARSLLDGNGLTIPAGTDGFLPAAHFPPLYAVVLAVVGLAGPDPLETARWLNALLFGANVFLVGMVIWKLTHGSRGWAAVGSTLTLSSKGLVLIHAHVWSEPAFFFFLILGLYLLGRYLGAFRIGYLLGAATATALACLTRYAGLAAALTGGAVLLLYPGFRVGERIRQAIIFLGTSAGPVGLWAVWNLQAGGNLANRVVTFHPVDFRDFLRGGETLLNWIFPLEIHGPLKDPLAAAIIILFMAWLVLSIYRAFRARHDLAGMPNQPFHAIPFTDFSLIYIIFILLSMSFIDAQTSLDTRILSPIFSPVLIWAITNLARRHPHFAQRFHGLAYFLLAAITIGFLFTGWGMARELHAGQHKGYRSEPWGSSRLVRQVSDLPSWIPIYSNGHDMIYLLTGRPAIGLPQEISPNSLRVNREFAAEIQKMESALQEESGVLVFFDGLVERRWYLPSEDELNELLPLIRITRWKDEGALYRIAPPMTYASRLMSTRVRSSN